MIYIIMKNAQHTPASSDCDFANEWLHAKHVYAHAALLHGSGLHRCDFIIAECIVHNNPLCTM